MLSKRRVKDCLSMTDTNLMEMGKTVSLPMLLCRFVCYLFWVYVTFNNLSVVVRQYLDVVKGAHCSLLECCLNEISHPRHMT